MSNEEEAKNLKYIKCPHCSSRILNKYGTYRGFQRYKCIDCDKAFTSYSETTINRTHHNLDDWHEFIRNLLDHKSMREIAKSQNMHYLTANNWRQKILHVIDTRLPSIEELHDKLTMYYIHKEHLLNEDISLVTLYKDNNIHTYVLSDSKLAQLQTSINPNQFVHTESIITHDFYINHLELYILNLTEHIRKHRRLKKENLQATIYLYDLHRNFGEDSVDTIYNLLLE